VPTFYNYPEKFRENPYREGFATELRDLIIRSQVDYWIYGHHHSNVIDFKLNTTKLITNQLGYVRYKKRGCLKRTVSFLCGKSLKNQLKYFVILLIISIFNLKLSTIYGKAFSDIQTIQPTSNHDVTTIFG
jgi:hypothetical protein